MRNYFSFDKTYAMNESGTKHERRVASLIVGSHSYTVIYLPRTVDKADPILARWATNDDLNFEWKHAIHLRKRIRGD